MGDHEAHGRVGEKGGRPQRSRYVPVEGEAGAAGDSGDAGDDEAAEARKPARRKASAPAGAGANPGRSKQSRNKPPAEKSGKGRSKGGRGRRSSGRGRRK